MHIIKRGLLGLSVLAAVGAPPGACWPLRPVPVPPGASRSSTPSSTRSTVAPASVLGPVAVRSSKRQHHRRASLKTDPANSSRTHAGQRGRELHHPQHRGQLHPWSGQSVHLCPDGQGQGHQRPHRERHRALPQRHRQPRGQHQHPGCPAPQGQRCQCNFNATTRPLRLTPLRRWASSTCTDTVNVLIEERPSNRGAFSFSEPRLPRRCRQMSNVCRLTSRLPGMTPSHWSDSFRQGSASRWEFPSAVQTQEEPICRTPAG